MRFTRRRLIAAVGVAAALPSTPAFALVRTPAQTEGPFYPTDIPLDHDADLVTVDGRPERARGTILHLAGRVLEGAGAPAQDVRVEVWQCDAEGRYHHPADRRGPADPNFQGYGRTETDHEGRWRFRTIRPVAYPGRTPHIHFALSGPGFERLTTQMYVAGEPGNARDGLYRSIRDPEAQASVTVALEPADRIEPGALTGNFDIVLGLNAVMRG